MVFRKPRSRVRPHFTLVTLAAAALIAPAAAQAGPLTESATSCAERPLSQPFLPWADPAHYEFAPNGGFEQGGANWGLAGGAAVVSGNESYRVHDAADRRSLSLPAGASATSAAVCVGIESPATRFFALNSGSPLSTLEVEVLFEDAAGNVRTLELANLVGTASWQPSVPVPVVANLLPLLPGEHTAVAFRFTAEGAGGAWRIDDLYIDPYRRG